VIGCAWLLVRGLASRLDEFRKMAQADEDTWRAYLKRMDPAPDAKAA
jgi:hypothetical protein